MLFDGGMEHTYLDGDHMAVVIGDFEAWKTLYLKASRSLNNCLD